MSDRSTLLLEHHLKELKLPSFLREYGKMASQCAAEGVDHSQYLLRLAELELIDRHQRMVERRIRSARFPAVKSLDTFDFPAIPSVNKALVMELARCEYIQRRENVIAALNSGAGKTHAALGLGLAACQRGMSVGFTTAAALVHELMEARDERRLLNLQRQLSRLNLLIIDELGFVPLSPTGAELLFEVFSQRYERGSILVTTNLPFDEWTEVFGSERLTGASRLGSGVLSEGRGLPVGLVPLLGGTFLSSSCSCFSAGPPTSFEMPCAFRRTSSSGSGPVWPVSGRPHRVPILSPSAVVPTPGGGAAPCAPGKCSPSGRARTALAAWLPLRSWPVQGGASSVGPSGSPFVEVYWWSFSVAAFLPVSSWWEGGRPHCSVPATGT